MKRTRMDQFIRIPSVSPTIRKFTGLPAPRPEPVFLLLCEAALRVASARIKSFHFPADVVSRGLKQESVLLHPGQDVLFSILSCLPLC
ncbi:hypothetical protein, partial [Deinococcus depolymerans]|uniref:hypothetical protein n=1 Tax=Deinococcus depolymerans TaxID=392408 RepID=UPI0031DE3573